MPRWLALKLSKELAWRQTASGYKRRGMKLPRFRGHLCSCEQGVQDAEKPSASSALDVESLRERQRVLRDLDHGKQATVNRSRLVPWTR